MENYKNSHLFNPFSSEKSPTGAFYSRLGYIYHHLIDIHAKDAPAAIIVTTLLIPRLICGHITWTLLVQDFHAKTERYQILRVHTCPTMPWLHVRAPEATGRSYRQVFGSPGMVVYSPICVCVCVGERERERERERQRERERERERQREQEKHTCRHPYIHTYI